MSWFSPVEPPASLDGILACSWTAVPTGVHRLVPDACIDVVWTGAHNVWVCGPERVGWDVEVPSGSTMAGVRFRPGVGPAILGVSAAAIADRRVPLDEIVDRSRCAALRRTISSDADVDAGSARAALEMFVGRLVEALDGDPGSGPESGLRSGPRSKRSIEFSDRVLDHLASSPVANAAQLASALGITVRQLLRRSSYSFGYGPATLARLLRLQRFLALAVVTAGRGAPGLAGLAIDAGYSDQAHLARECRLIARLTPSELLDEYQPAFPDMSDPFKTTASFAVTMVPTPMR